MNVLPGSSLLAAILGWFELSVLAAIFVWFLFMIGALAKQIILGIRARYRARK